MFKKRFLRYKLRKESKIKIQFEYYQILEANVKIKIKFYQYD